MLDGAGEDVLRLGEIVARIEQALDAHAVARPLLDLVEVAVVRIERVVRPSSDQPLTVHESRTVGGARAYHATADAGAGVDLPCRPHPTATVKRVDAPTRNAGAPPPRKCQEI
jgi:hypothetical protein